MFDLYSRARHISLGALMLAAAFGVTACAHTQQTPPADSASPRNYGGGGGGGRGGMRGRGGPRTDGMLEGLNLTKDQHAQIDLIRDKYRMQGDSMRLKRSGSDNSGAGRDTIGRAQWRSMMQSQMQEIRAVLNPDQQKQFDDKMKQMQDRRREHGGGPGGPGGPGNGGGPPPPAPPA